MTALAEHAVPALVAERAAGLHACRCGALPGACLERLIGPHRAPCCAGCTHHPELPHPAGGMTHGPEVCAAWADGCGVPRGVACESHWLPAAVTEWRWVVAARCAEARRGSERRARRDPEAWVSPWRLHVEEHYVPEEPDRGR